MKAVVAPISKSSFISTLQLCFFGGIHVCGGVNFVQVFLLFFFWGGRWGVGISYFVIFLLKVESTQQASPIPQNQNKRDLNPPPNPPKKEPCTCKQPSNSPQKQTKKMIYTHLKPSKKKSKRLVPFK